MARLPRVGDRLRYLGNGDDPLEWFTVGKEYEIVGVRKPKEHTDATALELIIVDDDEDEWHVDWPEIENEGEYALCCAEGPERPLATLAKPRRRLTLG